ncbi:MAG TPA: ABC transporter ATP-binding protein [Saprospiraceae bacterium]|nr:ABC transporter ATP-binding protein [Saprospiraceae bacterium]HMQ82988.1 ABC transporter ATP-binding protein [Saprospiraceae bacterium]
MEKLQTFLKNFLIKQAAFVAFIFTMDTVANLLALIIPLSMAQAYTTLFGIHSSRGRLLESWGLLSENSSLFWMQLLGICIVLKLVADYLKERQRGILGESLTFALRSLLYQHQVHLHQAHYEEKGIGRFLLRFSGDLDSTRNFITLGVIRFTSDIMLLILGLVFIMAIDIRLGVIILLILVLLTLFIGYFNHIAGQIELDRRNKKSGLLTFVNHSLNSSATIKAFNKEQPMLQRFEKKAGKIKQQGIDYFKWASVSGAAVTFGTYLTIWLTLGIIFFIKSDHSSFDVGRFFAIVLILLSWRGVLSRTFRVGLIWKKGLISWKKLAALLDKETESNMAHPIKQLPAFPLRIKNLGLHLDGRHLFSRINCKLFPGEILLLHGPANSGKTAFVKLLAGIYTPTTGHFQLGDANALEHHPKAWRRRLTFISNSFPLTGQNVFQAISYGQSARHQEKAEKCLLEWQKRFPVLDNLTLDTPLNDFNGHLSQSQIRLLMWMRAILSQKKIIVVDEPWQGLDEALAKSLAAWIRQNQNQYLWIMLSSQPEALSKHGIKAKKSIALVQPGIIDLKKKQVAGQ